MRHFYLFQPGANAPAIDLSATVQRAGFGPKTEVETLTALPAMEDMAALISHYPDSEHDKLLRYWQGLSDRFGSLVVSMYSKLFTDNLTANDFYVLSGIWNSFPANTLCFKMQSQTLGLLVVFDDLSIGSTGQILQNGKAVELDFSTQEIPPSSPPQLNASGPNWEASVFSILNYIGTGLVPEGYPVVEKFIDILFSFFASWLDPNSSDSAAQILAEIQQYLEQYKIQLETDIAKAEIETWQNWESLYFQKADFQLLSSDNPDKNSNEYQQALDRANIFITNVHQAFTTPSKLFYAVNLVKGDASTINQSNLDQPTDAMFKFTSFLYFSSFVLSIGKQGWIYSLQVNGKSSAVTTQLANAIIGYSKIYNDYIQEMSATIQQQISQRTGNLYVWDNTGQAVWMLTDNYDGPLENQHPNVWKIFGYNGPGNFNYCGNSQEEKAEQQAYAALAQLSNDFTNYFYTQIDPNGKADLQNMIQTFNDNNNKLQNLSTISS